MFDLRGRLEPWPAGSIALGLRPSLTQAASDAVSKGVSGASTAGAQIICSRHHGVPETTSRHRTTGWPWVLQTIENGVDRPAKPHR